MNPSEYDKWNEVKKLVNDSLENIDTYPNAGEVWMSILGKNIGYEQNGSGDSFSRPLLVIKKFNNHMFWVVPLSTKQKNFDFYHNYTDPDDKKVALILAQLKLVSIKRFKRKMYDFDANAMRVVREKIKEFLN